MILDMPKTLRPRVEKVAISLPLELLRAVERVRRETGETRSAVFRRAIEQMLGRTRREAMVREYVAGYLAQPETAAEIDETTAAAAEALASEQWE